MRIRRLAGLAACAVLLSTTACSSDSKVGDESLKTFKEKKQGSLDEQSPSARPSAKASAVAAPTKAAPVKHTAAPAKTAAAKPSTGPQVALTVVVNSDTAGKSQFDPSAARIYSGTCVAWRNADKVKRSVVADAGSFTSGDIAPGGSWTYCPKSTGKFNYHDGTRPYAVAYLEVLAR
jgi:plastocyanin